MLLFNLFCILKNKNVNYCTIQSLNFSVELLTSYNSYILKSVIFVYFKEHVFSSFLSWSHTTSWSGPDFAFSFVRVEKNAEEPCKVEILTSITHYPPSGLTS